MILISLGLVYFIADVSGESVGHWHFPGYKHDHEHYHEDHHKHHCKHVHDHAHPKQSDIAVQVTPTAQTPTAGQGSSKLAILAPLGTAMFFSPCIEIEAYYFAAGSALGWFGILLVSAVYFLITLLSMILFVELGRRGIQRLKVNLSVLEHHEQTFTGLVLILSSVVAYLVEV